MGVDNGFQGQGYGKYLVNAVIALARQLSAMVGCRYVTCDARPEVQSFYEGRGFVVNTKEQAERIKDARKAGRTAESVNVSMRFDLRPPGEGPIVAAPKRP